MDEKRLNASASGPSLPLVVILLGIAQIISWGSLYYSLTVLSIPIERDLGFGKLTIFGAFTLGLLVSGLIAPAVGQRIDREGGRRIMSIGSLFGSAAMLAVALAHDPIVFTVGWILAGVAMAACLYDPAFASLHQIAPDKYRRAVTGLTLLGGFASTVFWPASNMLESQLGWRWTFVVFAALHLLVCLPIHLAILPRTTRRSVAAPPRHDANAHFSKNPRFVWLAAAFACTTLVFSAISAFIVMALTSRGFTLEVDVGIAAMVGPMQVLARAIEWSVARSVSAIAVGITAFALSLASMLLLNLIPNMALFGLAFAICYGASNGILTIARGTVPAELFGPQNQGELLGALARPSFFTKAFAPALFAAGLTFGLSMRAQLLILAVVAFAALACFLMATRQRSFAVPNAA